MSSQLEMHVSVCDRLLREQITAGLLPHFPDRIKPVWGTSSMHVNAAMHVVGVSSLPNDTDMEMIAFAQERRQRCGIIVRTEDRAKWGQLSLLHKEAPFCFVVAIGGPRESLPKLFPGAPIVSDVMDLIEPGRQIAGFIAKIVSSH